MIQRRSAAPGVSANNGKGACKKERGWRRNGAGPMNEKAKGEMERSDAKALTGLERSNEESERKGAMLMR